MDRWNAQKDKPKVLGETTKHNVQDNWELTSENNLYISVHDNKGFRFDLTDIHMKVKCNK